MHHYVLQSVEQSRLSRRRFVGGAAGAGLAAAAAGLVGCTSSNKKTNTGAKPSASAAAAGIVSTPATAGNATSAEARAAATASPAAIDPTKGKPGGTLVFQNASFYSSTAQITTSNPSAQKIAGLVHSALLQFNFGHPPSNGIDVVPETELAQALPEQPDAQTLTFKLRPGVKFQNGRDLTSADVQYSYDAYAHGDKNGQSARASSWLWYDHAETPDGQTVVIKTKAPYADGVVSCAGHADAFILAKEFEEGPDSGTKMLGSGPFMWDSDTAPVSTSLKKNPNYFMKPYPYFDAITVLGNTDPAKQVSDAISKQVQLTATLYPVQTDQVKKSRPDIVAWNWFSTAHAIYPRCDQAPFNDKRVRQALSMALDRKAIRDATYPGQGEDDQFLSPIFGPIWGFRKPSQLGAAAKYWTFDVQSAKQLLTAAGVTLPIESQVSHPDINFLGQQFLDTITVGEAQWKQAGVANIKDIPQTTPQFTASANLGNYDGLAFGASSQQQPVFGTVVKNIFWSPPEGVTTPTQNVGHVNDPQMSALLEKQLTQLNLEDRKQTLHQLEDVIAEGQYRIILSTYPYAFLTDPTIRDNVAPKWRYSGSDHFLKYWWYA